MKKKILIGVFAVLFLISTCCTILGFIHKNKKNEVEPPKFVIDYHYYLEGDKVDDIPPKTDEIEFSRYTCTNGLNGEFNVDDWNFIPDNDQVNSNCDLYFVKSFYEVDLSLISNGYYTGENPIKVESGNDADIKIIPNEGYIFKFAQCSNDKNAAWDESTSVLKINEITSDISCRVAFEVKKLNVQLEVYNGIGSINDKLDYGDTYESIIEPYEKYDNPIIKCTNNQEGNFEKNKFIIQNLKSDTVCKITFQKIKPPTYKLKLDIIDEDIQIISGNNNELSVDEGSDITFAVRAINGSPKISCENNIIPGKEEDANGDVIYKFMNVTNNISCKITKE